MDEKDRKELIEELESQYVLIRKGSMYYFFGGLLATAIAIIGLSYASARSAIESEAATLAISEIERIKNNAVRQQTEISEILAATPGVVKSVPNLENRISSLENSTDGFYMVTQSVSELRTNIEKNSAAISAFAQAFDPRVAKLEYAYPAGYHRDPELKSLVRDLGKASENAQRILREQ
jgi:hypothetical protein